MIPTEFLAQIVRPNLEELADDPGSLRKGFNATFAVDALAAQLFDWLRENRQDLIVGGEDDTGFRGRLSLKSREFRLVRDIAKAQKHVLLERMTPLVKHSDQIEARPVGFGEGRYGEGRFGGPAQVMVRLDDGTLEYVAGVLDRAVIFLEAELRVAGAIV